jgi:hypothetical protein
MHWLSGFVRHETLGTPSEVPVPKKTILEPDPDFCIEEAYRVDRQYLNVI